MATKQNDAAAMTQEQLDGVSGGPHYSTWGGTRHDVIQRRRSSGDVSRVAMPDWARPYRIGVPPEPK